eukprot:CAMPEP_0117450822 /NCGR_PEP_ID=MMETSP0759-20121206/8673_1 /TAXON_ID=63605 /ORGANISM="Percolomonas cosmopolitus, Strain WS" /LENGTH=356 /DNA_ID=CAMNT_0005243369 /DNA_START=42 /DNA_END=1112 /DNA_ORIENTATION=-
MFRFNTLKSLSRTTTAHFTNKHLNQSHSFYSTILICEQRNAKLTPATLSAITAAQKLNQKPVTAIISGEASASSSLSQSLAKIPGIDKVVFASNEKYLKHQLAEAVQLAVEKVIEEQGRDDVTHIVAPHTVWGKNLLPRLSASFNTQPITDVIQIDSDSEFVRPIYAGNAIAFVKSEDKVKLLSVRPTAFDKAPEDGDNSAEVQEVPLEDSLFDGKRIPEFVKEDIVKSDRPELGVARVVVSGGRGLKNGENFSILYELADELGGTVGATRAVVDAGFVSNDLQVGQTGKVVAPELYIACGISGQLQHIAGMKDSKCIVAINKDPEAPFFQIADYGLVTDLFDAVPKLTEMVRESH